MQQLIVFLFALKNAKGIYLHTQYRIFIVQPLKSFFRFLFFKLNAKGIYTQNTESVMYNLTVKSLLFLNKKLKAFTHRIKNTESLLVSNRNLHTHVTKLHAKTT